MPYKIHSPGVILKHNLQNRIQLLRVLIWCAPHRQKSSRQWQAALRKTKTAARSMAQQARGYNLIASHFAAKTCRADQHSRCGEFVGRDVAAGAWALPRRTPTCGRAQTGVFKGPCGSLGDRSRREAFRGLIARDGHTPG